MDPHTHPVLDAHHRIAWDFDETLIGDHPNAAFYRNYILLHPEKVHYIVTFRDKLGASSIPWELSMYGVPYGDYFTETVNCPSDLFGAYVTATRVKDYAHIWDYYPEAEQTAALIEFPRWKGLQAKRLGCTLLVDDMEHQVMPGCTDHGIVFLHSHHKR